MDNCIFCKIVSGEIPCMTIYEDKMTLAFMDVAKDVDGHMLVIPKHHSKSILDCDSETIASVMRTVKNISRHLIENCGYEGVNLLNANEECAGQSVPHFHIHIIPRRRNDQIDAWPHFYGAKEDIGILYDKVKM